jgi:hypothetical protein
MNMWFLFESLYRKCGALCGIESRRRNGMKKKKKKNTFFFSQHKSYASYIIHGDKIMNPTSSRGGISSNETHGLNAIGFLGSKKYLDSFCIIQLGTLSYLHLNGHSSK